MRAGFLSVSRFFLSFQCKNKKWRTKPWMSRRRDWQERQRRADSRKRPLCCNKANERVRVECLSARGCISRWVSLGAPSQWLMAISFPFLFSLVSGYAKFLFSPSFQNLAVEKEKIPVLFRSLTSCLRLYTSFFKQFLFLDLCLRMKRERERVSCVVRKKRTAGTVLVNKSSKYR